MNALAATDKITDTLSFVLPVALRERLKGTWRHTPNVAATIRTRLALASFVKQFDQQDLREFWIVCPGADQEAVAGLLESVTRDPRYRVVDERELCPEILQATASQMRPGWIAQQLIKLAIAKSFSSSHYVTLDSDIVCVKPFSHRSLIQGERALTNVEKPADFQRIYTPQVCENELNVKEERRRAAAEILGYRRPAALSHYYGETPVVLHRQSVIALTEHLSARFQGSWIEGLASRKSWTEYNLYFQFLEMTQQLPALCVARSCNTVLDLEKSVWLSTASYRQPRRYDRDHFLDNRGDEGFFVAIQSWLPVDKWLPARCSSLQAFYDELEAWLL